MDILKYIEKNLKINIKNVTHWLSPGGDGAEVIYALRNKNTLAKKILNEIEKSGQNVRKYYQLRLPSNTKKDYYFIHRDTPNNESLIIEYGFVDSTKDDASQIKNNYKNYAEAVVKAICEYKGIKYKAPSGLKSSVSSDYYTVKKGDTLWDIAVLNNTTVKELKDLNNLSSDKLKIGDQLLIPSKNKYIVKKGDSLWKIAKEYNTSISDLIKLNNLKDTTLQIGQVLTIN